MVIPLDPSIRLPRNRVLSVAWRPATGVAWPLKSAPRPTFCGHFSRKKQESKFDKAEKPLLQDLLAPPGYGIRKAQPAAIGLHKLAASHEHLARHRLEGCPLRHEDSTQRLQRYTGRVFGNPQPKGDPLKARKHSVLRQAVLRILAPRRIVPTLHDMEDLTTKSQSPRARRRATECRIHVFYPTRRKS